MSATIVSIWPKGLSTRLPYGDYEVPEVPACEKHGHHVCVDCHQYTTKVVEDRNQGRDIGFGDRVLVPVQARPIAEDVIRGGYGMFVLDGDVKPTKAQLEQAREELLTLFNEAVRDADGAWNRYHDVKLIPETARMGATVLGLKREWLSDVSKKRQCESCGDFVPLSVVKCKCGAIYDWQRASDLGMLTEKQEQIGLDRGLIEKPEPVKRGPGRPPKEASL